MDPILSVLVTTYGHENYISEALDSILSQETKYPFEVLVGEDASPDNTRIILRKYEENYPGKFKMFYRPYNFRSVGKSNLSDLKKRARGKYLIVLEGDDFWTDKFKLEKQITFLETHPEYVGVAHNCIVVGEDSKPNGEAYPECKDSEYSLKLFSNDILAGQSATFMYKNYLLFPFFDTSIIDKMLSPGDRLLCFAIAAHGKIYVMQETMSAYRHVTKGGYSFSANSKYIFDESENYFKELLNYAYHISDEDAVSCAEKIYLRHLLAAWKRKKIKISDLWMYSKNIKHKFRASLMSIEYYLFEKRKNCDYYGS